MNPDNNSDTFYVVDFDRTLADSDKLLEVFMEISQQYIDIPKEQIEAADRDVRMLGDANEAARFIRDRLAEHSRNGDWEKLEKQFIHECRALNMLLPGATELLDWLQRENKRFGILTYGNPLWQRLKLTATGFKHIRHIVIEHKEKGKFISSWLQEDGKFAVPEALGGGVADKIVLIDDKAVSFSGFPPLPSKGYWVLDPDNELPSQLGDVPPHVERYRTLHEFLRRNRG